MSRRLPKSRRGGKRMESVKKFFGFGGRRKDPARKARRLMIDPLEQRQLLSLSVGNLNDILVNQTVSTSLGTIAGQSLAVDHAGDAIAVWTRIDAVRFDPNNPPGVTVNPVTNLPYQEYEQIIDPRTGAGMIDSNIYARYLTNQVQRIVLPESLFTNNATKLGNPYFSMLYSGGEVQQMLSFSYTNPGGATLRGTIQLGINLNGDDKIDPLTETTLPIPFDEANWNTLNPSLSNAAVIQKALRDLAAKGGDAANLLQNLTVEAVDSLHYKVIYPFVYDPSADPAAAAIPNLMVAGHNFLPDIRGTGNLPSVQVTTLRQPTWIGIRPNGDPNIPVSLTNPAQTALAIESAFQLTTQGYPMAPVFIGDMPADQGPIEFRTPAATVKVVSVKTASDPLGLRTFDVSFVGNSGLQDHPLLVLGTKITNDQKAPVALTAPQRQVATITKGPSPEFRVNPPEPDDVFTPLPDVTQQSVPAVAMDSDGDFVITWQSEVPDAVTPGSKFDIFAQRFSPAAIVSAPNLVISNSTLSILEGQSKSFTVSLASRPFVPVTVTIARRFGSDVRMTASAAQLTFTPANWDQPQSVSISTPLDADNTNSSAWFDVSAGGITAQTVTANAIDLKSLIVSRNSLSVVEGNSDTFNVKLASAPPADVTINVSKLTGGDADLTASAATLTFTPADWNVPQTITVSAARETPLPPPPPPRIQDSLNGTADFLLSDPTSVYSSQQVTATEADDWANLLVSTNNLTILEGNSATFTVMLSGQPTGSVEVKLLKQSDGDPSITANGVTSIFFDATTWNVPQPVQIFANADTDSINNGTAAFYLVGPNNAPVETVNVTMIDEPRLDILFPNEAYTYLRVPEGTPAGPGSASFSVRLPFEPVSNVTVTVTAETGGDAGITVATATRTFTPATWDIYQTFTINAANDTPAPFNWPDFPLNPLENQDGLRRIFVYASGFATQQVNAVKINNDPWAPDVEPDPLPSPLPPNVPDPPFIISISSSTVYVSEGSKSYVDVRLIEQPSGDVTVSVRKVGDVDRDLTAGTGIDFSRYGSSTGLIFTDAPGALPTTVATLVFNAANWNQPHRLWLFARPDGDTADGSATFEFFSAENDFQTQAITAIEADDDIILSPFSVSQPVFYMKEGGPTATFNISSTTDVKVDIVRDLDVNWPSDDSITVSTSQVDLNAGNGRTATVTITAANDVDPLDFINGVRNFYLTASRYRSRLVTVNQIDKDISPVVLSTDPQNLAIAEGEARVITARLSYRPTADTTVTIAKTAGGDGDLNILSTTTLTFTPTNWNQPQQVNFVAAEDDADGVNGTAQFTFSVAGYPDKTLTVSEIENDAAALVVSTDFLPVLEGNSRTFSVALPAAPAADVTVTITRQSGSSDLQVFPTTLTFTPANWNVPQLVKISAISDPVTEADTATFAVSATGYNGVSVVANKIDKLQGARPLGNAFRVNTFTVDAQFSPAVSMDQSGNFVITWSNQGQDISFFNGIVGQRFNRDGDRVGNEFMVNAEDTYTHGDSYVSLSPDGQFFIVVWMMGQGVIAPGTLFAKVYNANQSDIFGNPTVRFDQSLLITGVQAPTAAWNYLNDFIISWDQPGGSVASDIDHTSDTTTPNPGTFSAGVYGAMWDIDGNLIRDMYRANSGDIGPFDGDNLDDSPILFTNWPGDQVGNQVAVDADGDVTVIYSGFGPDASQNLVVPAALYAAAIEQMEIDPLFENADLLIHLIADGLAVVPFHPMIHPGGLHYPGNDPDLVIQEFLTVAWNLGATRTQLGRMQQILSNVATQLRGDANGVMFTQFDADPVLGPLNVLNTDNIVNAHRDGSNHVFVLALDQFANDGDITLNVAGLDVPITIDFSGTAGTINPGPTAANIHQALTDDLADITDNPNVGMGWDENPWTPGGLYEGPIEVRIISAGEYASRLGTDWDLRNGDPRLNPYPTDIGKMNGQNQITSAQYFFEITVQGELHDSGGIALVGSSLEKPDPANPSETIPADVYSYTQYGPNPGTDQSAASIGMQPEGSFAVSWTQTNLMGDGFTPAGGNSVYLRTFVESTDTAGPRATDFILDDNTRLKNNGQVLRPVQYLVVTFDEAMATTGVGSILNKANWSLLKDGVPIAGGISEIYFGMNAASQITDSNGILLFPGFVGTNKYEAVIKLDANGATAGVPALTDGHYQLVALNSMRDVAGNPLGRTGFSPNGFSLGRSFEVSALTGSETPVSGGAVPGNQTTQTINDTPSAPSVPHAVANDGNGDYVVVWTDSTPGQEGVWAKLYRNNWTQSGANHTASAVPYAEIRVSSDPSDTYASVAMDGDGDFVVTWSRDNSAQATPDFDPAWDVYARRYNALGQPRTDDPFNPLGNEFLVNTETEDVQRYSDVAMDVDGDFIVTWQSMNQDESGYGVYMQRFSPAGEVLGGTDDVQQINFIGRPQGTFKLQWVDGNDVEHLSAEITLPTDNDLSKIVDDIQLALEAMGAHVIVTVSGDTTVMIQFTDVDSNKDQSQIIIPADSIANLTGDPGRRITVTTLVEGAPGEARVNDTTLNDQMFPSIGTNASGLFVITWTGFGQDTDAAWQSNIYAKQLNSNDVFRDTQGFETTSAATTATDPPINFVTTADNPANHVVQPGTGFDGVVQVLTGEGNGSGTLLLDRNHILTAAHVVAFGQSNQAQPANQVNVVFTLTSGAVTIAASEIFVHPGYTGDWRYSPDIAIITLAEPAPLGVQGFDIYRKKDEVGKVIDFYGYGNWGTGVTGGDPATFGIQHHGKNKWESTGEPFNASANLLVFDFDDGTAARDAFGNVFGINDLGLGVLYEADQAHGDSGGPSFINGLIAGTCSGPFPSPVDLDTTTDNSTFGEFVADTRVSSFAFWIDAVLVGATPEFLVNQETFNQQKWSSVGLDGNGDFVISWTSYGIDGTGNGAGAGVWGMNGVYARKFDNQGIALAGDFKVNTVSAFDQQRSQVAMTSAGDFDIVWESFQDRAAWDPSGLNSDLPNSFGVYAQRYGGLNNASQYMGPNGELGSEFRLNTTLDGDQRYPSIAMDANGDLIAVWTGSAVGNPSLTQVFSQRFDQKKDIAGPFVTEVLDSTALAGVPDPRVVYNNSLVGNNVSNFIVVFDENLSTVGGSGGVNSVLNPNNWQLAKTSVPMLNGVSAVQWVYQSGDHRNPLTGKFEVSITFDSDPDITGNQILTQGLYTLTVSQNVQDVYGNSLDGDYNGVNGGDFTFNFTIDLNAHNGNPTDDPIGDNIAIANAQTFPESARAIATALNGKHIATWTATYTNLTTGAQYDKVYFKVFDADGAAYTNALAVTTTTDFDADHQRYATIACDGDGDFVITWTNVRNGNADVYARRFNAKGEAQGDAFRVNTYTVNEQKWSNVAMEAQGDFIVTWSSYGQEDNNQLGKGFGVYARRYNSLGQALAPEFQVNTTTAGNQQNSTVAMANDGKFIVVWQTDQILGQYDIYARVFNADGTPNQNYGTYLTGDIPLNATAAGHQQYPDVAMNADGSSVVVAWQSSAQDGNGWGIYHLAFDLTSGFVTIPETRANISVLGDQLYPSVAMAYNGKYVITWSGAGDQPLQSDRSGSGVFYREYQADGTPMISETRVNKVTVGDQWISSVALDQRGKAYIVFTGPEPSPGTGTNIYRFIAPDSTTLPDIVGPIATSVAADAVGSIIEGSVIPQSDLKVVISGNEYTVLNVYFSENLSTEGGVTGQHSVLNKQNWKLYRNGVEITGAVVNITFGFDASTRKYRAVVTIDGTGFLSGTSGLAAGDYQLVVSESIWDTALAGATANALDGDFDGVPGTNPTLSNQPGYVFHFTVADSAAMGAEFRVNNVNTYNQALGESFGTGFGREQSRRSVAIDHNGDFAAVWTSYGQDQAGDLNGGGVYLRIFGTDRALNSNYALTGDILVNSTTLGNQRNASVAMGADGNLIVVWQSEGQDPDGSSGIYGQLFDLSGNKIGGEFRVNTEYTNDQVDPAVATDAYGNFVVVWATTAQSSSFFNDVKGQLFDFNGLAVGNEFLVNALNIPGGSEVHPTVAMNYAGDFVVAWDQVTPGGNTNGVVTNTVIMARRFDRLAVPKDVTEFQANVGDEDFLSDPEHIQEVHLEAVGGSETTRRARNPQAAMDFQGNFIIAWESFQDNDVVQYPDDFVDSYGIYFRRFSADGTPETDYDHQANLTITANFPEPPGPPPPLYTVAQSALYAGDQVNPSIAMDVDGDYVIVWDGNGAQPNRVSQSTIVWSSMLDDQGVFSRTFHAQDTSTTTTEFTSEQSRVNLTSAGSQKFPAVAMTPSGDYVEVWSGNGVGDQSGIFARRYKDPTDTAGPLVTRIAGPDGKSVLKVLIDPTFTPDDTSSNIYVGANGLKYLVVTFDEDMLQGDPALVKDSVINPANYRILHDGLEMRDAIEKIEYGKSKASQLAAAYGLNPVATNKFEAVVTLKQALLFTGKYSIQALAPKAPTAANPTGSSGLRDRMGNPLGRTGFSSAGADAAANFAIVVSGQTDQSVLDNARTFPESARTVAVAQNGQHVAVWTSFDSAAQRDRAYMRLYDANGQPAKIQVLVNGTPVIVDAPVMAVTPGALPGDDQRYATVACDADGDFVVTWTNFHDDNGDGVREQQDVYARRFSASGTALSEAFRVNAYTANNQKWSKVAMDAAGDFIITWSSYGQEDNGQLGSGYGVYARRYNALGQALGQEFQANVTTAGNQQNSSVAMADNGRFVIVWQSNQNGVQDDIVARQYNADGSPIVSPNDQFSERLVNTSTAGNQRYPDVAYDRVGDSFVATWQSSGQDGSGWGVYSKNIGQLVHLGYANNTRTYFPSINPPFFPVRDPSFLTNSAGQPLSEPITVPNLPLFNISDINVTMTIVHPRPQDLTVTLIAPDGTRIRLVDRRPRPAAGRDFLGTTFDDQSILSIADPAALPPFSNSYVPEQLLAGLNGNAANGVWYLEIEDILPDEPATESCYLDNWSLSISVDPALAPDTRVSTSTVGDQMYPAVSMARDGSYVVAWSGRGDQKNQEDKSGQGVFYQRFKSGGVPVGVETRANFATAGDQWMPSVGVDGEGNAVIVYTGAGATAGTTNVFKYSTRTYAPVADKDGPVVAEVLAPDRTRIFDGDTVQAGGSGQAGISQLIVVFGENMSILDGAAGQHSVLNPGNWSLYRGGNEIVGGVTGVTFGLNPATRKYEAVLALNGSGLSGGATTLADGNYTLVLKDLVWDDAANYNPAINEYEGNFLDGDYDGAPGTGAGNAAPPSTSWAGFAIDFTAVGASGTTGTGIAQLGAEFRVNGVDANGNSTVALEQAFGPTLGRGYALEQSRRSMAADHSGDFVVVWTAYGKDDPNNPNTGGVYLRLFDRANKPLTTELQVNTTVAGNQRNASVAMDADGDFVVVWESQGQDPDGSWGVYARRYDSMGRPKGGEFRVNTIYTNDQFSPAVALDPFGNFVVAWASTGQAFSYNNDIKFQLYDYLGNPVGGETRANAFNIPGTNVVPGSNELHPAVAMDYAGNFVVSWDQVAAQTNGLVTDTNIVARLFDGLGNPRTIPGGNNLEFRVNVGDDSFVADPTHTDKQDASSAGGNAYRRTARNSQVTMDGFGNFIVVWESFQDNDNDDIDGPESYGVYYRRFAADGRPLTAVDHQANLTITAPADPADPSQLTPGEISRPYAYDQVNPTIAIDVDGDYVIAWEGQGAQPNALNPTITKFNSDEDAQGIFIRSFRANDPANTNANEAVTVQARVNRTGAGNQKYPAVAMTPDGQVIVAWSGAGVGDSSGIFARRYAKSSDTAGPMVTAFSMPDGSEIAPDNQVSQSLQAIIISFDEEMATTGPGSVFDPNNYRLLKDGIVVPNSISKIFYGLNQASLLNGQYGINAPTTNKYEVVIVVDANGSAAGVTPITDGTWTIVVWNTVRDKAGNPLLSTGLNQNGQIMSNPIQVALPSGTETKVNAGSSGGKYTNPHGNSIAGDQDGDHVVVWTDTTPGHQGIYAKMFETVVTNVNGTRQVASSVKTALKADGTVWTNNEIRVTADSTATDASVARDVDGDFIVTWSSWSSETDYDVYAQRFNASGIALGAPFLVNTYTTGVQRYANAAMDADGNFVITWQSLEQKGDTTFTSDESGFGIFAQRYSPAGLRIGGANEVQMINFIDNWTGTFRLAFDHDGDDGEFTADKVTASIAYNGNTAATAYALQSALQALGVTTEVAPTGSKISIRFIGAYGAQPLSLLRLSPTGYAKTGGKTGARIEITRSQAGNSGEFRVNDTTQGDQVYPAIGMSEKGDFVVSWTSFGQGGDGLARGNIYAKKFPGNNAVAIPVGDSLTSYLSTGSSPSKLLNGFSTENYVSTYDDPNNHVVPPGTGFDGVVAVYNTLFQGSGSGALIANTNFILTAAHVVEGSAVADIVIYFDTPTGRVTVPALNIYIHPNYNGNASDGNDVALVELGWTFFDTLISAGVPNGVLGYELYRATDEVGKVSHLYGYGTFGTGWQGEVYDADDKKRTIDNRLEATGTLFGLAGDILVADFDDGTAQHDAFGRYFGLNDLGLGVLEGGACHGDSGGPSFIDGKIAGVTSFGIFGFPPAPASPVDFVPDRNSSFGEFYAVARVSSHLNWIDSITRSSSGEFLVNENTIVNIVNNQAVGIDNATDSQNWSSVAMDADGDFVISWTSYGHDIAGGGANNAGKNGIYARRFNSTAHTETLAQFTWLTYAASDVFQVNNYTVGNQQYSHVAMDADGDIVIAWESFQDNVTEQGANTTNYGIYAKRFARTSVLNYQKFPNDQVRPLKIIATNNLYGPDGEIGGEIHVGASRTGNQTAAGIAIDSTGDFIVSWSGNGEQIGQQDTQGVFLQRFNRPKDDSGPMVGGVYNVASTTGGTVFERIVNTAVIESTVSKFVVTVGENLSTQGGATGFRSILNPANWSLLRNGAAMFGGIAQIEFGLNQSHVSGLASKPSGKYEIVLTFDGDSAAAGNQPLGMGNYSLIVKEAVYDLFGNKFDGDFNGAPGGNFTRLFSVISNTPVPGQVPQTGTTTSLTLPGTPDPNDTTLVDAMVNSTIPGQESAPKVAANANGDYVVVWVSTAEDTAGDVKLQRFDRFGRALGAEIQVSSYQSQALMSGLSGGAQLQPDVAMDAYGNFVVVWSGFGFGDDAGAFARIFDTYGSPMGEDFRVNQYVAGKQDRPSVAMDSNSNIVVSWTSSGQDSDSNGVYARRFDLFGQAKGDEFLVNSTTRYSQQASDVAMDQNGNFTVVWQSDQQDGNSWGIFGQRFNAAGQKLGGEFRVNTFTNDKQTAPKIAMDADGDFMVAWQSFAQDGNGYGVYARRYNAAGAALESGEFRVNKTTANWQYEPAISAAANGNFVVLWAGFGQDDPFAKDYGIYAHMYKADGGNYVDPNSGLAMDEFRVNVTTYGSQLQPAVAMDANGDFIIAWVGPDPSTTPVTNPATPATQWDIFSRIVVTNTADYLVYRPKSPTNQFSFASANNSYYVAPTGGDADLSGGGKSDINGDGTSDVLWFNQSTGVLGAWIVKNGTTQNWTQIGQIDPAVWKPIGVGDFNGDKTADILWQNQTTGGVGAWIMKNAVYTAWAYFDAVDPAVWRPSGVGDFNGDGTADLLWQNMSTGGVGAWIVKGGVYKSWAYFDKVDPTVWRLAGVGDFNGDKTADVLWHNQSNGGAGAWIVKNGVYSSWAYFDKADPAVWKIAGVGDFNGDGNSDVLWHNQSNGGVGAWIVKGGVYKSWAYFDLADPAVWDLAGVGDFNGDGTSDVLWHNQSSGAAGAWIVKNGVYTSWAYLGAMDPAIWKSVGRNENPSYLRAETASPASSTAAPALTQEDLQPIVREAVARWSNAGLNADALARLSQVQFVISDLPGSALGKAEANRIYLDLDAAGNGWFVDSTPDLDEEFILSRTNRRLEAVDPRAVDRIDLLSVVEHELGHLAGFDDLDLMAEDLMRGALGVGIRQNPK